MSKRHLQVIRDDVRGADAGPKQRPHKPQELGSRVFRKKKSRWYSIDLRWRAAGRPLLRDPRDPAWPEAGAYTDKKRVAQEWAKLYDERWKKEQSEAEQRRTGRYRSLRLAEEAYLRHRRSQNAPSTYSGSKTTLRHLIEFLGPESDPATITTPELQEMCNEFLDLGYKASSVGNLRNHLKAFFKWAKVKPNPAEEVAVPEMVREEIVPWGEEERRRIRRAADQIDSDPDRSRPSRRLLVEYLFATGTRIQEAAAGRWEDFRQERRTVRIKKQIARGTNEARPTKSKKERTAVVMEEWWDFNQDGATGLVFGDGDGNPIPYRTLYTYLREVLERAGLKKAGEAAHQFRHTYAYLFLQRDGGIDQLQKSLGHRRVSTTHDYYDHFTSDEAAEAGVRRIYGGGTIRRGPRGT